jgi:hypothetical protein
MKTRMKKLLNSAVLGAALLGLQALPAKAEIVNIDAPILPGTITNWVATNTYILKRVIFVHSNAVLNIEPGTVIKGATGANVSGSTPGITEGNRSALIVTRGGKLFAEGTPSKPIIFTYDGDDVNDPNDIPFPTTGQWGGVVLLGRGVVNSEENGGLEGSVTYEVYEGVSDEVIDGFNVYRFGGTNDMDCSGVLRYVSIRHSGIKLLSNKEFNGLTMGGIGKGTIVEHVEVYCSSDDGFEWWGGCADAKYLVAAFCEDDGFDYDQGYRGRQQFLFAIQADNALIPGTATEPRGIETDGEVPGVSGGFTALPTTIWKGYNITLIGSGLASAGGTKWGIISRDNSGPNIHNSVVTEFSRGLTIDADGLEEYTGSIAATNKIATINNTLFNVTTAGDANATTGVFSDPTKMNDFGDPLLVAVSRTNNCVLDPRPVGTNSPVYTNVASVPDDGFFVQTAYRGAFSKDYNWAYWTGMNMLGHFSPEDMSKKPVDKYVVPMASQVVKTNGVLALSFMTEDCLYYNLQCTTNLSANTTWTEVARVKGNGGIVEVETPAIGSQTNAFYRLRLVQE